MKTQRLFLPIAALILLVAAALRLGELATYPPGPHYDEAAYLLITRSIAFGGARFFPIVEAYQGREVLYMYLNAPLLHLLGDHIFTLRLTSAFCNLLTLAAAMALGRAMFGGRRGLFIGLAVGVLMALSWPQIWLSRQAFRAVTLPLLQALALLCLWRGLGGARRTLWLALGGFFAGAALYTYMASRLFPFWLALGGVVLLLVDWRRWRLRLGQGAIFFGALAVTAAPMVVYAVQRPDVFFARLNEVTQPGESVTLLESVVIHARMFFIEGEGYLRYNIPGRPYLTLPEGVLMLVGLGVAAWRLLHRGRPTERAAYALALLSPLMIIPSVISVGGLPPNHMRSLGMIPLIFVLVAVGFEAVWSWAAGRLQPHRALRYGLAGGVVVLLAGALLVGAEYFNWAQRADVFYETDADLHAAARWLIDHPPDADTLVYIAARDRGHPTLYIEPIPPATWLGTDSLFRAPTEMSGLYIFPRSAPPSNDWRAWLEPGRLLDLPLGPDGRTAFEAFRLPGDTPLPPSDRLPEPPPRSPYLTLVGAHFPAIPSGGDGQFVLDWRVENAPPWADLTPLVQLETPNGALLYRGDAYLTETDRYRPGEVLSQRMAMRVPAGTPPGDYPLRIAWVGRSTDQYVSYLNSDGTPAGIWAQVGRLTVTRPPSFPEPSALPIAVRQAVDFAPGVRLLGWDVLPSAIRPGETLRLALYWQAVSAAQPRQPLALRAMLNDTRLWEGDLNYSPRLWVDGEVVIEHVRWRIPREQPAGENTLRLETESVQIDLGSVHVEAMPRRFDAPPVAQPLDARFGGIIALEGYTLTQGDTLDLQLVWRALKTTERSYTVFVHIVDANGVILDQRDVMPGAYPTSLWLPGEVAVSDFRFARPASGFVIRVGLYWADDGSRLDIDGAEHSALELTE